jgi:ribosome-associated protein
MNSSYDEAESDAAGLVEAHGRETIEVSVRGPITLGQLLKLAGAASTGGQAKLLLTSREVTVNGRNESRRGRKLLPGDLVGLRDRVLLLVREPGSDESGSTPMGGG